MNADYLLVYLARSQPTMTNGATVLAAIVCNSSAVLTYAVVA